MTDHELEDFIRDLRERPVPDVTSPNYLEGLIRQGERLKICVELETCMKISRIENMRKSSDRP